VQGLPILIGATLGVGVGVAALPFYTAGVFMLPLQRALGWSRTDLSMGLAASTLMLVVGAPVSGRLADRFGTRRVGVTSLTVLAAGFLAMTQLRGGAWTYIVAMGAISLLSAGSSPITFTRAISLRFDRARGLALGLTLMGIGISGALAPAFVARLIAAHGWRAGYVGLASVVAIAVPLVFLLAADAPRARSPIAIAPFRAVVAPDRSWVRTGAFWSIATAFFLLALAQSGPIVHFIPMLRDAGMSGIRAARDAAAIGISVVAGRLVTGWLLDRVPAAAIAATIFALSGMGSVILGAASRSGAVAAGALLGLSLGAEVDVLSYMTSRYFTLSAYGEIYGYLYGVFSIGAAAGPVLTGLIREREGTYLPALIGSALLCTVACLVISRIGGLRTDGNDFPEVE